MAIEFLAQGVVDAADHSRHMENMLGNLGSHNITVIALGQGNQNLGVLYPGSLKHLLVKPVTHQGGALKGGRESAKAIGIYVQDGDRMPISIEQARQLGANSSTAH